MGSAAAEGADAPRLPGTALPLPHAAVHGSGGGALGTTREVVGPAARFAVKEGLTNNLVVETYTWNVLAGLAERGTSAQGPFGPAGAVDVQAGIMKELQWASEQLEAGG